jgi:RHS repeat-associated protein
VARVYVHGGRVDEMVASQGGGQWRYYHYDARGHCLLLTSPSGALLEQYEYDAFGFPYFHSPTGAKQGPQLYGNRFLFTGREWLGELRLYDYRNRMYEPELGRFLQPDPKQFEAGDYNLYRYCHNDPVNKSDPTGLDGVRDDFIGPLQVGDFRVPNSYDADGDGSVSYRELTSAMEGGDPGLQAPTIDPIDILSGGIAGLFRNSVRAVGTSVVKSSPINVAAHGLRHFPEGMRESVVKAIEKDLAKNGIPAVGTDVQRTIKIGAQEVSYRARGLKNGQTHVGTATPGRYKRDTTKKRGQ